jgi:ribosomal protein S18 acetylase RimI-like enzyme
VAGLDRYQLEADAWLSRMLGRPAWTVVPAGSGAAPLSELSKPGVQFATARVNAADTAGAMVLQAFGFRVVDMGLTLEAARAEVASGGAARFAGSGDRAAVEAIAGSAFRFSRFHLDPKLPKPLADKVKATWAANWFLGARGDGMVVAEYPQGTVAGFLQLRWAAEERLVIDLIAVRQDCERRGLARAMIGYAWSHGTGDARRPRGMIAGTQAANIASIRLYESLGFRLREARFVLHHHGSGP